MSSFYLTVRNKATGEEIEVFARDDHFGSHEYGYRLPSGKVLREEDFYQQYERVRK